jgi:hypothetical protein
MFFTPVKMLDGTYAAEGYLPVELAAWKAVDVDEPDDLRLVELLLRSRAMDQDQ